MQPSPAVAIRRGRFPRVGTRRLAVLCLATTALSAVSQARAEGTFGTLPDLSVGAWHNALAISGNGSYVAGRGNDVDGRARALLYDRITGAVTDLGDLGGGHARANDVSDGGVATGASVDADGRELAFRWTAFEGMQSLGSLNGFADPGMSAGLGISDDGTRIVGYSTRLDTGALPHAFVWIEGATTGVVGNPQMFQLEGLDPERAASATAISGNGIFAVGWGVDPGSGASRRALRWDLSQITTVGTATPDDLGTLGGSFAEATAVSRDGRVVVGYSSLSTSWNSHAFRWVEGGTGGVSGNPQMQDLGTLGGPSSQATAVSGDGAVVVGWSEAPGTSFFQAFRWTETTGMVSVADWLSANGVGVGSMALTEANGVSDDGSVIVGQMEDPDDPGVTRAYIARVSDVGSGLMDVLEYNRTLYGAAQLSRIGQNLAWLPMNGSHHRPLMDYPTLPGGTCFWVNGDLAHYGNGRDATGGLAEAGLCADLFEGQMRVGLGLGTSHARQDLMTGGSSKLDGQYVIGEIDWRPQGTPILLSLTGLYGGWDADIRRSYTNGGSLTTSQGDTNVRAGIVRLRADWQNALTLGSTTVNPFVSLAVGRTVVDGYTETFGSFPARFDAQTLVTGEGRLGILARTALGATTTLGGSLELVHATGDAARARGQVLGLYGFDYGGGTTRETWVRVGADLDQKIGERALLSLAVHAATRGYDATLSGAVRFQTSF